MFTKLKIWWQKHRFDVISGLIEYAIVILTICLTAIDLDFIESPAQIGQPLFVGFLLFIGVSLLIVEVATPDWDIFHWAGCTAVSSLIFAIIFYIGENLEKPRSEFMIFIVIAVTMTTTTIFMILQTSYKEKRNFRTQRVTFGLLVSIVISLIYLTIMFNVQRNYTGEFCAYFSGICPAISMLLSLKFSLPFEKAK